MPVLFRVLSAHDRFGIYSTMWSSVQKIQTSFLPIIGDLTDSSNSRVLETTFDDTSSIRFTSSCMPALRKSVRTAITGLLSAYAYPISHAVPESASAPSIIATIISAFSSARKFSEKIRTCSSLFLVSESSPAS